MDEIIKGESSAIVVKEEPTLGAQNILIEIDDILLRFLRDLEVGSLLSLSELVSLASRFECEQCQEVFYSSSLFQQHSLGHVDTKLTVDDKERVEVEDKNVMSHPLDTQRDKGEEKFESQPNPMLMRKESANVIPHGAGWEENTLETKPKKTLKKINIKKTRKTKLKMTSEGLILCDLCPGTFKDLVTFKHHKRVHKLREEKDITGIPKFEFCPDCNYCIPANSTLARHRLFNHDVIKKCPECDLTFDNTEDLKVHERKAHYRVKYYQKISCEICGAEMAKNNLKEHKRRMHGDPNEVKTHICDQCGRGFSSHSKMLRHRVLHWEKKFICTFPGCDKAFHFEKGRSSLEEHFNDIHMNIRPFSCDICGSTFAANRNLIKHRLIHSEERNKICPYCSKGFKQEATLYRHKKSCHLNPEK